jgi:hypothetical protein
MSLPHFSEESGSPYFPHKQHRKRVEAGYLFTLTHNVTPLLPLPSKCRPFAIVRNGTA